MNIEFAKSMSGHDRNQYYLIIKKDDEFVYLVNGTTKPLTKPKKKNRKHTQIIKYSMNILCIFISIKKQFQSIAHMEFSGTAFPI